MHRDAQREQTCSTPGIKPPRPRQKLRTLPRLVAQDCTRNPLSPRDAENLKTAIATQDEKRDEMFAALQAKSDIVKQDALALTKLQVVSVEKNTEASKRAAAVG